MEELYAAWRVWCEVNGRDRPGTVQTFGRNLRAAVPTVRMTQLRTDDDQREGRYTGIALRSAHNDADRVPSRASGQEAGPARDGTRPGPMRAVPDVTLDGHVRCSACDATAQLDTASAYGRRRLAEGHLEYGGAPWRSAR